MASACLANPETAGTPSRAVQVLDSSKFPTYDDPRNATTTTHNRVLQEISLGAANQRKIPTTDFKKDTQAEELAKNHAATQFKPRIAFLASFPDEIPLGSNRYANLMMGSSSSGENRKVPEEDHHPVDPGLPHFQCIPLKEVDDENKMCGRIFDGKNDWMVKNQSAEARTRHENWIEEIEKSRERIRARSPLSPMNLFIVVGLSLANVHILDTEDGLVLLDTSEGPRSLQRILVLFNEVMQARGCEMKPVRLVILSHFHTDHTGGLGYLEYYNDMVAGGQCFPATRNAKLLARCPALSIAHTLTLNEMSQQYLVTPQASYRRAMKQFGSSVFLHDRSNNLPSVISAGIGSALVGWTPRLTDGLTPEGLTAASLSSEDLRNRNTTTAVPPADQSAYRAFVEAVVSEEAAADLHAGDMEGHCGTEGTKKYPAVAFPTHTFDLDNFKMSVAGHDLYIKHSPGESVDQVNVFIPSLRTHFMADNFYAGFPNIYPLRGGTIRSPIEWVKSIDYVLDYYVPEIDVLSLGHTLPILGKKRIRKLLERYRDAMQFIDNQSARLLNTIFDADAVARSVVEMFKVHFPVFNASDYQLADNAEQGEHSMLSLVPVTDPLLPFYGNLEWAVKALVFHRMGWFQGSSVELKSHSISNSDRAKRLKVLLTDKTNFSSIATQAIHEGDCQWALELLTIAAAAADDVQNKNPSVCPWNPFDQQPKDIKKCTSDQLNCTASNRTLACLRRDALFCLARDDVSSSGRNWYLFDTLEPWQNQMEQRSHSLFASAIRNAFISTLPDQAEIVKSFSTRFQPGLLPSSKHLYVLFTVQPASHSPFFDDPAAFLHRGGENRTAEYFSTQFNDIHLTPTKPQRSRSFTIRLRNSVIIVRALDDDTVTDAFDAEVVFSDEALKQIFLRQDNPLKLLMSGKIKIKSTGSLRIRKLRELLALFLAIEHQ